MQKTYLLPLLFVLLLSASLIPQKESPIALDSAYEKSLNTPLPPDTGDRAQTTAAPVAVPAKVAPITHAQVVTANTPPTDPVRLVIPSISLNDTVAKVGVNAKGEMDVPAGNTANVGWYDAGTVPGNVGSAVIDAHVFAAFSKLKNIKLGSDIYIKTDSGQTLHFVVSDLETYALADVPADTLFNRADTQRLNLITCAGKLTADRTTYDHRLVVYATLATS